MCGGTRRIKGDNAGEAFSPAPGTQPVLSGPDQL